MKIEIKNPCRERWEEMEPRGEGRFCARCERTVVDLSRLTRREAEARVARATDRVCLSLVTDARTHELVFRPEPRRAPQWMGLAAAAFSAGCATEAADPAAELVSEAPIDSAPIDTGPLEPMRPLEGALASVEPVLPSREVPISELDLPADSPIPTAHQRALTERKHAGPPVPMRPPRDMIRTLGF